MEDWQKDHIRKILPELMKRPMCDSLGDLTLVDALIAKGILGDSDYEELVRDYFDELSPEAISTSSGRVSKLFKILETRTKACEALIEVLHQRGLNGPKEILLRGYVEGGQESPSLSAPVEEPHHHPQTKLDPKSAMPLPVRPEPKTESRIQMNKPAVDDARAPPTDSLIDFKDNISPLEVRVVKPKTEMSFDDDFYALPADSQGYALILNITKFDKEQRNRAGAKHDTKYMHDLWMQLGYEVTVEEGYFAYLDVLQILHAFKSKFDTCDPHHPTSCVIFIGSHGEFSTIEASDHQAINLYKDIIYNFDSKRCPALKGRPKVFIIQACQRFQQDSVPSQDQELLQTPIDDAVVCFSTLPGYVSKRDTYLGTWFTYCFAKVVMEEAHRLDLLKLLKRVQEQMHKIVADAPDGQLSTYWDFGIKTMYFNMNPH